MSATKAVRLPDIGNSGRPSLSEGKSRSNGSPNRNSLPRLSKSQGANAEGSNLHGSAVTKENTLVVSAASGREENQLPEEWTQMRVNPHEEDDSHRTKLDWENQIAKHILSLFATSHAVKNINEGSALLDFVEVDKGISQSKDQYEQSQQKPLNKSASLNLLHTRPSGPPPPITEGSYESDFNSEHQQSSKRKKKKVKKVKKVISADETERKQKAEKESQYSIAERVILRVHAEAEAAEAAQGHAGRSKSQNKDKHRITNTITLKDGNEIVVRGTPRCFPIWFVSTGDVYADWTVLPGGAKLQAHLNVLYEQCKYNDYLGILETIIVDMWRRVKYGKEDFTQGSFGHTAQQQVSAHASGTHTGTNTGGTNTGNNTARSASRGRSHSQGGGITVSNNLTEGGRNNRAASSAEFGNTSGGDPFGDTVVWEDAGEEGLVPRKISSPAAATAAVAAGSPTRTISSPQSQAASYLSPAPGSMNTDNVEDPTMLLPVPQLILLWRQLILATIAMGILYLERKHPDKAMLLFKRAEEYAANDEIVSQKSARRELRAHCKDAISYYFFKRKKSIAALGYSEQAMALYEECDNIDGIAVCLLHVAAVYSQIGDFKTSHLKLFQFLAMVESGRLSTQDATPKQLCLVAIGYHNLAVVQLKLAMPDLACKNSQNARKIARLCLSYSNRWIDTFQYTHEIAISDVKYDLRAKKARDLTEAQLALVIDLSEALFDPYNDAGATV
eukprot:gene15024-17223_t